MPVKCGVWVFRSQKRTVLSPDPLTRCWPLGEKATQRMAAPWPGIVAEHRATGRTRNSAWGWYTTLMTRSMEVCEGGWKDQKADVRSREAGNGESRAPQTVL